MGGVARPAVDGIDLADVVDVADQHARRRAADVRTGARRDAARLQRQSARDLCRDARQPGVDVVVANIVVPRYPPFVAIGQLPGHPRGAGGDVDAGGDGRIGQHVAAVEIGVEDLPDLDIGRHLHAAALRLRPGGGDQRAERDADGKKPPHLTDSWP